MGKALRQGDISPMLKMATGGLLTVAGAAAIKEALFKKKPSDMTWTEWMNLDNPESARFLVNQASAANLGGFVTQLAAQGMNYGTGVKAYGPRTQAAQLVDSITEHTTWLLERIEENGELTGEDVGTLLNSFARNVIQDYRLITEPVQQKDNNRREVGMYNRIVKGERYKGIAKRANPVSFNTKYNREDDMDKVADSAVEIFQRALEGKPVPATPNAFEDPEFYPWLDKMQGDGAGQRALDRDRNKQLGVNQFKSTIERMANKLKPDELKYNRKGQLERR